MRRTVVQYPCRAGRGIECRRRNPSPRSTTFAPTSKSSGAACAIWRFRTGPPRSSTAASASSRCPRWTRRLCPITPTAGRWGPGLNTSSSGRGPSAPSSPSTARSHAPRARPTPSRRSRARSAAGNKVPFDDLSFGFYVGRFGRYAGLIDFLNLPTTRLTKARTRVGEIYCARVEGTAQMTLEGDPAVYIVTMLLAAAMTAGCPCRPASKDGKTGLMVREYRARSLSNDRRFSVPARGPVGHVRDGAVERTGAGGLRAIMTSSLKLSVEKVAVNQGLSPESFTIGFAPGIEVRDERIRGGHPSPRGACGNAVETVAIPKAGCHPRCHPER